VAAFCVVDVKLVWCEPPITRRLLVPTAANLGWLHAVLQVAMGWEDQHLHMFRMGDVCIGNPDQDPTEFTKGSASDESTVTLAACLGSDLKRFEYVYDFGDTWKHQLVLKRMTKAMVPIEKRAVCLAGERACPPEDCGGPPGYMRFVEVLSNQKHPEYAELREWFGRPFDPEYFSVEKTNRFLAKLPWPKVSPAALGRVVDARDKSAP
jgi:Plasmid pRiA4b ORF-3-like protein